MAEIPEDQNSEQFDTQHLFDLIRRRHMHFLIPLLAAWCAVWGASWILPPRYKSNTLILVEQPTMPKNYVLPNINDDLQARLQSITQQILSRTRLLTIIDKMNLYGGRNSGATEDQKVAMMRKDIDIELVHDQHNEEITAFRINFTAHDPHLAQQVTSELTDLFITENLKVRQEQSEDTTKFIEDQLEEARTSLSQQEAKVRAFEALHEGVLPSQQASNLQILSGLQAQLQNEQDALNTAKQQRVYLQALIEQNRALHTTSRSGEAGTTDLPAIDQELGRLKSQLLEPQHSLYRSVSRCSGLERANCEDGEAEGRPDSRRESQSQRSEANDKGCRRVGSDAERACTAASKSIASKSVGDCQPRACNLGTHG